MNHLEELFKAYEAARGAWLAFDEDESSWLRGQLEGEYEAARRRLKEALKNTEIR